MLEGKDKFASSFFIFLSNEIKLDWRWEAGKH
jgi:hypothetical protein